MWFDAEFIPTVFTLKYGAMHFLTVLFRDHGQPEEAQTQAFHREENPEVLFAEAGSDVVDLLFSLLSMPIGSVVKLLTKESMVGCLSTTYNSLQQLDETYFVSSQTKSQLLNPTSSKAVSASSSILSKTAAPVVTTQNYYKCEECNKSDYYSCVSRSYIYLYITDVSGSVCPTCQKAMSTPLHYMDKDNGFVKKAVAYTITDDLSVEPMSTTSTITLFSRLGVNDLRCIEQRTVSLGPQEYRSKVKQRKFQFVFSPIRKEQKKEERNS
ncbi:hypothetical protein LUZ62_048245 [Rhynchospora pubera]|uniref:Uncharacterized protein n=1 Tax=Rhynchospora pubera TaxID=906938 RepID=A0AAV8FU08_9POAL|nr:hypothetical protein LUZ62_048245 [Rhynchospora pubera]